MSDVANNDLELYAKALDKCVSLPSQLRRLMSVLCQCDHEYHGLKMEEVNDTMRHLWNRTYQGTGMYVAYLSD